MNGKKREEKYYQHFGMSLDELGWNHPSLIHIREKVEEENKFIENPVVDIAEGIIQCGKCKSKRTFSYQKQVRSSDEGFTLFVNCVDCNSSWVEN
jgi:DNA-directed RNA polymerase subunit M/transcription elongation factor TFIIS